MAVPALATEESIRDVIERMTAEGQLTRNSGTNSIKSLSLQLKLITDVLLISNRILKKQFENLIETSKVDQFKKEEDEIEASRKTEPNTDLDKQLEAAKEAASGKGFLGILIAALPGILAGLSAGLVAGFARVAKTILKTFDRFIFGGLVGKFLNGVKSVGTEIGKDLSKFFKSIRAGFAASFGARPKFLTTFLEILSDIGKTFRTVFSGIGKTVSAVGKTVKTFSAIFAPFFTIFATLGRFIAFPITVITGVVAAVKGFIDTEGNLGEKLLGGALAAFDAIILAPLDLLRKGVAFILDKLGFDGSSEFLKSFSFSELFQEIINVVVDSVKTTIDFFKNTDFMGIIKNGLTVLNDLIGDFFKFLVKIPKAIFAGLKAGGINPIGYQDRFGEAFNSVMASGSESGNDSAGTIDASREQVENARRENTQAVQANQINAPQDNSVKSTTTVNVTKNMNSDPVNPEGTLQGAYAF